MILTQLILISFDVCKLSEIEKMNISNIHKVSSSGDFKNYPFKAHTHFNGRSPGNFKNDAYKAQTYFV